MTTAGRGGGPPPAPWWSFVAAGAIGPALILQTTGGDLQRLIGIVLFVVIVVGLLVNDHGRRALRPRRQLRSAGRTWRFTVLIVAVIIVTQLVQRAADARSTSLLAVASFVILTTTSWWFTRRLEADEAAAMEAN